MKTDVIQFAEKELHRAEINLKAIENKQVPETQRDNLIKKVSYWHTIVKALIVEEI